MTTTERLCSLLHERHEVGLKKYGVTLDRDDITREQWIQHAIEEMLDGAGYLMRLKDTIADMRAQIDDLTYERNDLREKLQNTEQALREAHQNKTGGVVW